MNTAELIYQEAQTLPESTRLEVLGFITLAKQKLANLKKETLVENETPKEMSNSEQAIEILNRIAKHRAMIGTSIDMDDFEQSRQDRELDR